jgi:hypothetical protein
VCPPRRYQDVLGRERPDTLWDFQSNFPAGMTNAYFTGRWFAPCQYAVEIWATPAHAPLPMRRWRRLPER